MIEFKTKRIEEEWDSSKLHPFLLELVLKYADLRYSIFQTPSVITCILSTEKEDKLLGRKSSTHRDGRAVDMRIDEGQYEVEEALRVLFNARYPTGIKNMPRIPPLRHGSGPHAHIQITIGENKQGTR